MLPRYTNKSDRPCDICQNVNIFELLVITQYNYSSKESNKIALDWIDNLASRTHCPLCRLVVHCLRQTYSSCLPPHFWNDGLIDGRRAKCFIQCDLPRDHKSTFGSLLVTTEPSLKDLLDHSLKTPDTTNLASPTAVLLSEGCIDFRRASYRVKRRRLWPDVSLELLKAWITICCEVHPYSCGELPGFMRVIDLDNGCLVDASPGCRYVTLSYVWGEGQNFSLKRSIKRSLYQPGSLSSDMRELPWTIRDFLVAVVGLGEGYAWVDSLCIVQDDPLDVQQNVQAMDVIFKNAVATIVAASGTCADSGLPGVRLGTRQPVQGREIINRMALGAALPPLNRVIETSTWNSRGWTYQENVLSHRVLFFTDSQVHYKCKQGCTACEETWEDDYDMSNSDNKVAVMHSYEPNMLSKTDAADTHQGLLTNLGWWKHHVYEMCRRKTREPKDRFHALEGVLAQLRSLFDDHEFVCGLPTTALDIALLWHPQGSSFRNVAIDNSGVALPSWSWVGWTGDIWYRMWNICETSSPKITWIDMTRPGPLRRRRFTAKTCGTLSQKWLDDHNWRRELNTSCAGSYYLKESSDSVRYSYLIDFKPL